MTDWLATAVAIGAWATLCLLLWGIFELVAYIGLRRAIRDRLAPQNDNGRDIRTERLAFDLTHGRKG